MDFGDSSAGQDAMRQQGLFWREKYQSALEANRRAFNRLSAALIHVDDPAVRERIQVELDRARQSLMRLRAQQARWGDVIVEGRDAGPPERPIDD